MEYMITIYEVEWRLTAKGWVSPWHIHDICETSRKAVNSVRKAKVKMSDHEFRITKVTRETITKFNVEENKI
jgi:hypothetical protein